MNKKFSTFLTALGLASVVLTPSVQAAMGNPSRTVSTIEDGKYYQLSDGSNNVLVMVDNGSNGYTLQMVSPASVPSINASINSFVVGI